MQSCCSFKKVQLFTLVLAAFTIVAVLTILFFFNYPTFAKQRIIDNMVFKNGSDSMERFKTTKDLQNLRLSVYVYNVTNPDDFVNKSAKIKLQEIGPFVYNEYKYREFIKNDQEAGLITYRLKRRYTFDEKLSVSDARNTQITWPNVPLIVAGVVIDRLSLIQKESITTMINLLISHFKEKAFITDSVENFLFDGSKRLLFEELEKISKAIPSIKEWPLKDNMFAILYDRNDTWNPTFDREMTTAIGFGKNQSYDKLNQYVYVNGSKNLTYWRPQPPGCNAVGGTDGQFFSPFLDPSQNLEVYSLDICRKLSLKYRQDCLVNGITAHKFTLDEGDLQSGSNNPNNQCYCLKRTKSDIPDPECGLDGLIDLSKCTYPNVVASGAHFYSGSQKLLERVEGVTPPNETLHEPVLYVEPNTGLTIKVRVPIQFNIRLEKNSPQFNIFKFFKDEKPLLIPLLWVVESSELTEEQASMLKNKLLLLDSWLVSMVLGGAIVLIIAILVIATVLCVRYKDSRALVVEPTETDPIVGPGVQVGTPSDNQQPNTYQTI